MSPWRRVVGAVIVLRLLATGWPPISCTSAFAKVSLDAVPTGSYTEFHFSVYCISTNAMMRRSCK